MSPRRLVITIGRRNHPGGFGDLRLGEQISGGANETKELAQSGLTRTAVTGKPSSAQRLERLELVVRGATSTSPSRRSNSSRSR
jgi:hypothetical protein